jgi:AGCS family alanine or glycine:cation symporter
MLATVSDFLWSYILIVMLVGLGVWFSVASRFVQFRYFGQMFRALGRGVHHQGNHISSFQALVVSVAGRVGGGNIAGVAVAITLGGPGAVFWMWIIGLMGMATSFFECSLAQLYKRAEPDGTYRGGPAYYMSHGLGKPWMAAIFSVLLLITFGFGFNSVQSYIVATSVEASFGIPTWATGLFLATGIGFIIFGGIKRIAKVAEFLVPIMAGGYFLMALVVLVMNITEVPAVLMLIIKSAMGFEEAVAGGFAAVLMQGVKRGLFSNEAGLGSGPNVAAVAYVPHPADQGMVQALSVFIDTLIMCTCTAVIILLSDVYQPGATDVNGVALTQNALAEHVGSWGQGFVSISLLMFSFSSIMYNYYLGENSLNYFSEENQTLFRVFRVLVIVLVMWGAMQDLGTVFIFADLTMALLGVVNLAALAMLSKVAFRVLKDYEQQRSEGKQPQLNAADWSDLDIDKNAWQTSAD